MNAVRVRQFPPSFPSPPLQSASASSCIHLVLNLTVGKAPSHTLAKEVLAAIVASQVDRLIETKGRDWFDKETVKHHAKENAERMYEERYEN